MIKRLTNSLHSFPLFSELAREQRRVLGKFLQCINVMKGEALFEQGQEANGIHIVVSGEIAIKVQKEQSASDLDALEHVSDVAQHLFVICRSSICSTLTTKYNCMYLRARARASLGLGGRVWCVRLGGLGGYRTTLPRLRLMSIPVDRVT